MIELIELSLQRGKSQLLQQVDLRLHAGHKVGLIGANGSGKSSLFQLLLGGLEADGGELKIPSQWRLAHMAQEVAALSRPAVEYVLDGDLELRSLQQQLADAESQGKAHDLGELHARLAAIDGYSADSRARQLMHGLGFSESEVEKPVSQFSGGWRIRLNLAQALMSRSDLLLLDEPTNHLDLDATLWLEQWLKAYEGTLLLISHDRDFLDRVVGHIVHLHQAKLNLYKGNYSAFEKIRAERLAQQQSAYEKQQQRITQIEGFVRRFKAKASKAKQAQSRIKELERMELIAPAHVDSPFSFSFDSFDKLSSPLLALEKAELGYGDPALITNCSLSLQPEMRIGLLGANGTGKSTLIKSLVGDLPLCGGVRREGENLRIGYFAQHQLEALDLEASALLHLQRLAPTESEQRVRDYLGSFGFRGDDCLEPVRLFSGGEKARLALALIAWQKPNLLLMDEPTNHLDLEVRHALTLALQGYPGALILVSHDRHLLRNCVDEFLLVSDGKVEPFDGDLNDYARWLAERNSAADAQLAEAKQAVGGESAQDRKERKRQQAARRQQLAPLRKQVAKLEAEMEQLESQLQQINDQLADSALYEEDAKEQLKQLLQQQAQLQQRSETTEEQWLSGQEELEQLLEQE
ncbi:ATP-binding cassette domain-containing protein [Motiliproteus coralliicola]|uniref:Probable ATP-binding protein YheS n=1 Tax=Motiliproteus coralliicola TaxID=2283196 RepID=A0A369WAF8_9GAMM|nr:ATP-binding cassette domain-containing protein [Motiliproteus coralliicola]RDE18998.1 ATP-binding cassette domain-containing protein [Motiliproteus coralliicola]